MFEQNNENDENIHDSEKNEEENGKEIDLVKVNKSLHEENQDLKSILAKLREEQEKLILATKVNTLKEQEIRNDEFRKYANQKIIKETIVPLLLEFERALNFRTDNKDVKNFLIGFNHIFNNFKSTLKSEGLEEISLKVGDEFDSNKANVTEKIEITEETKDKKDNMVAEILLTGYKWYDRVISPVQVKIYKLSSQNKPKEKNN